MRRGYALLVRGKEVRGEGRRGERGGAEKEARGEKGASRRKGGRRERGAAEKRARGERRCGERGGGETLRGAHDGARLSFLSIRFRAFRAGRVFCGAEYSAGGGAFGVPVAPRQRSFCWRSQKRMAAFCVTSAEATWQNFTYPLYTEMSRPRRASRSAFFATVAGSAMCG